ncbi:T9SS type A sorting domain-containing protein [Flavobacterium sp. KACC 22761]|uniref:T9SS type A sorting domain-containing protein n=1 Tax=Flavobacterium sp. KACC 22761 TaxID=3092665 RepID=UPI002A74B147|nr:T9SS type A sorting domain-containing protein [Flavobacterium sp. KACC 22761]WPO80275.1 T9SS type A sorting domain-containing protein [Flavobacterium sp. KACC 22761]
MKTKLLLLLFLANFSIHAQINLVPNGDFTAPNGVIQNWTVTNVVNASYDYTTLQYSARLSYTTKSPKITTQVPMKAGVTYTIKYKYKYVSANYSGDHPIALNISQTGSAATLSSSTFATNNLWTEKTATFTADKDLSYDLSLSTFSFDSASFEVLIDAVQVYVQGTEQYTKIPNLNFEKKLIALGLDSGTTDGQVPTININSLSYLDVSNSSITDLTGIEDFTALATLNCNQAGLTSLDLSKNQNLLKLNCGGNYNLKSFDASKNPNLVYLDCSNLGLSTLNLASNTALQYLEASNNSLTTLDLSNNTNLLEIQVRSNKLTTVDLSKNTALKQINFTSNLITSLNVSNNTALTVLELGSNKLTNIDLSKNNLLADLGIYGNQLTSLDLSNNNALVTLNCSANKLSSLNLKNGNNSNFLLSRNIGYTNLNGNSTGGSIDLSFASNALSCIQVDNAAYSNTNWSALKDKEANFTSLDCSLSTLIPDAKFEDQLIALGIDTDGKNGAVLNSSINTVATLDVSAKGITNLTGIEGFVGLKNLNVSGNALKRLNLSKNTALTTLNTSNNSALTCIEVPDLALASTWIITRDATTSFSLDCNVYTLIPDPKFEDFLINNNIDKDGKNGKVLTENIDKITILNIYNLGISDLTGIQDFTSLIQLQAYGNGIETIDVSKNTALTSLTLSNNKLSKIDLSKNTALVSIDLSTNLISEINLTNNVNLKSLRVSNNNLSKIDVSANTNLTYILANNNKLTSFDISKNPEVYQVWCSDNQIRNLDFSKNAKLTQVMAGNNKLVNLNFKNGANTLINVSSGNNGGLLFTGNPDLKCIQVDDVSYSNTNWSAKKDATATFSSVACPVVIPYTLIPDANFEAKLIALGIDKDGIAGKVETMNVVTLTSLDVSNSNIADLTGIQDFTALTALNASNNKLATIDVSKNTGLKTLNISSNQLTSINVTANISLNTLNCAYNNITALNVTKNTELNSLSCNSNAIQTLDVSKNAKLTLLSTSFNKMQYLDVSKNTLLKEFDCASNDLYNLNLKNGNNANMQRMTFGNFTLNPHLVCIEVDDAAFAEAKWIAKDATATYSSQACPLNEQQTLIPDISFERILIAQGLDKDGENGKVRTASISGLTSLTLNDSKNKVSDLTGIQDFKALSSLDASNNTLKTIDLSKNTELYNVNLSNNQLTSIDFSNNAVLWVLKITNNQLTTLDLSKNTELGLLSIDRNQLTTLDVSKNTKLSNLDIGDNKFKTIDLSQNTKLRYLSMYNNLLTSLDLSNNLLLETLQCSQNQISTLDLSKNNKLYQINLAYNKLYNLNLKNGANSLININYSNLKNNTYLTCITVDDVTFSNANWSTIKDATSNFSSEACPNGEPFTLIPDVNFENKLIALGIDKDGPNGKVATYSIDTVTSLNVSKSNITDLTGIQNFTALTTLEAADNKLTTIDVSKNRFLTNLNVSKNQLTSLDVTANYNLVILNCSSNAIASLNGLSNATLLNNLNCSNNAIKTLDVSRLLQLNTLNCSTNALTVLDVSKNTKLVALSASINQLENLDISKNILIKEIDCASNNLYNLNLKNGNNVNFERVFFGNFTANPNLLCIQVDDAQFSKDNWIAKDATATYSSEACPVNGKYTLIPDVNFEKLLIAKNIDTDGENGKVLTASISKITYLNVTDNTLKVSDLTGIQDFTALETLYCYSAALTSLDVSKNVNLITLDCSGNKITSLDFSKNSKLKLLDFGTNAVTTIDLSANVNLTTLSVSGNQLSTLDVSKNTALLTLYANNNKLTGLDITKNINLTSVSFSSNLLTSLDVSNNTKLAALTITDNQVTSLDLSKNPLLASLFASTNKLESLNISNNTLLNTVELKSNKITTVDFSKNAALKLLVLSDNKLTTLDLSQNPVLMNLNLNGNQLTSLNLKNGKNTSINSAYLDLRANPKLYCILVDDVVYANTNWTYAKDTAAKYNTECTGELTLPANNFAIETKGESCLGQNNGEISITAKQTFAYVATINGKATAFTNNTLKVTTLTPGNYTIAITIPGEIFEQNFNVTIQKGATITGKSSVSAKKVDVEITEGTAPFTVFIDGQAQFQTNDSNFSLDLEKGGLLEVATSKACEGVYSKKIATLDLYGTLAAYPNPTSGSFEIEIPTKNKEVTIELYNFGGQLVSAKNYTIENGKVQLSLENQPSGIYAAKIYFETPEYIKIIKK